jgi:hypothetical protein
VAEQQTNLSTSQRQELAKLLVRFPMLLSGKLGCFPNKQVHLELQKDALVVCTQYPNIMSKSSKASFNISVTLECSTDRSKWLSPSCITSKKHRVRCISNFQELNKLIKRQIYNLPKIQDKTCCSHVP